MKNARQFIPVIALFVLGLPTIYALGRSRNLRGTIIAYDPMYHGLKQASFVKNLEVTVADLGSAGNPQPLVKVVFEGFGKSQLSQDVLDGEKPFQGRAVRDKSCDEAHPRILSQAESEQAHRAAEWYAARLLVRYGRGQVIEWLRSGVPASVVASLRQR